MFLIVDGMVPKQSNVEICTELRINSQQDIQIELGSDAGTVVIGSLDNSSVLL